ncbi:hypothetical protein VTN00DRAFT_7644 [Thermoascus crustaceus]|uniref:uncharacterized protein n=1 Tax=Thermoascus crustaceus TaxID=5088 RepID=UPI0037449EFA
MIPCRQVCLITDDEILNPNIPDLPSKKERAKATSELTSIEPPPDAAPRHIGGGRVRHKFFKYSKSPVEYRSVSELENHVNNVDLKTLHWMHRNHPGWDKEPKTVDLSTEKLICCYSDIYRHNFPVDKQGQVWVVDFDHAGVLPASFMSFALDLRFKDPLPPALRAALIPNVERTKNLRAMQKAFRIMQMAVDEFGLSIVPDYEPP